MTDREKLVKLLHDGTRHCRMVECRVCEYFTTLAYCKDNVVADHLLANGVTFATDINVGSKWISVEDRLPEQGARVLVFGSRGGIYTAEFRQSGEYRWFHKLNSKSHHCKPTHWMPLPEPPKGD